MMTSLHCMHFNIICLLAICYASAVGIPSGVFKGGPLRLTPLV